MNKTSLTVVVLIMTAVLGISVAQAHTSKTSGTITGVLHIEQGHVPVAGIMATPHVTFKDTANLFDIAKCDCTVAIAPYEHDAHDMHDGTFTKKFSDADVMKSGSEISFDYTFPMPGKYLMHIAGKPIAGAKFNDISMDFDITATSTEAANPSIHAGSKHGIQHSLVFASYFGIGIAVGAFLTARQNKMKQNEQ